MRIIIELEGPVLNVEPAYWAAYSGAAASVGLARTDRKRFWRAIRRGAGNTEMFTGARPRQLAQYERKLAELLESEECLRQCEAQEGVATALGRLGRHGECVLVTTGRNRDVRQKWLDEEGLSAYFVEMHGLSADPMRRPAQLRQLSSDGGRAMVAAGTAPLARAASEAGLVAIGITAGPANARHLRQAGVDDVCADLDEVAERLDTGGLVARHGPGLKRDRR